MKRFAFVFLLANFILNIVVEIAVVFFLMYRTVQGITPVDRQQLQVCNIVIYNALMAFYVAFAICIIAVSFAVIITRVCYGRLPVALSIPITDEWEPPKIVKLLLLALLSVTIIYNLRYFYHALEGSIFFTIVLSLLVEIFAFAVFPVLTLMGRLYRYMFNGLVYARRSPQVNI